MSYIRANEFVLQSDTVKFIYEQAVKMGYTEEQIEELLAAFDRDFLRKMKDEIEIIDKNSPVYKDLESFINGEAYGYNIHFCMLRYGGR